MGSFAKGDVIIASLSYSDFSGGLNRDSAVRVCHLFSLDPSLIDYKAGVLRPAKIQEVTSGIVAMLTA